MSSLGSHRRGRVAGSIFAGKSRKRKLTEAVRCGVEPLERRVMLSAITPSQMRHAYGIDDISFSVDGTETTGDGTGQTIAIVVAYDDPQIVSDTAAFNTYWSLPQFNGTGDPTLTVVNQSGGTTLPSGRNTTWGERESLAVQWAHVTAPQADILVVEADSDGASDLLAADATAADASGVSVVTDGWNLAEFSGETADDSVLTTPTGHPGVMFVAAAGDSGEGAVWPSASPNVLSVGGTSLTVDDSGDPLSETAWSSGGGGASAYESQPSWQSGAVNGASDSARATPDVSMDADPDDGVQAYDTQSGGPGGWFDGGGTNLATQMWGGLIAIADQGLALQGASTLSSPEAIYDLPPNCFNDITSGSNGTAAVSGYDTASGLGSPVANVLVPVLAGDWGGDHLVLSGTTSASVTAGGSGLPTVTVDVEDSSGSLLSSDDSTVTLSVYDGQADGVTLADSSGNGGTITATAVDGVAVFNNVWLTPPPNQDGTYVLEASDGSDLDAKLPVTVTAASAETLTLNTIASFTGNNDGHGGNGSAPYGGVTIDSAGDLFGTTEDDGCHGDGTVFEIAAGSDTITTLASFNGTNGANPTGKLVIDSSGDIYGTTTTGGASNDGTVFEIAAGGDAITTLASFERDTTGASPASGLVMDSAGNLYGTTSGETDAGYGTVYEIAAGTDTISTLAFFASTPSYGALTLDSAGDLFGTTWAGGTYSSGTVFEIKAGTDTLTTLATFDGGDHPAGGVILDSAGNLFGTTYLGGEDYGSIYEVEAGSDALKTLAKFNGDDLAYPVGDLALDRNGNLFGACLFGGTEPSQTGAIFELAAGSGTITAAASFDGSGDGSGAPPYIAGLTMDSHGNLFGTTVGGGEYSQGSVFELESTTLPAWLAPGSQVDWNAQAETLAVTGKAWIIANPADFGDGAVTITGDGTASQLRIQPTDSDTTVQIGSLTLTDGATSYIGQTATPNTLTLDLNALDIDSESQLDLGDNGMLLNYGSGSDPLATIRGYLQSGYNGGAWTGDGIITSSGQAANNPDHNTGIGYADSADGTGINFTADSIEFKYALYGDANLDGSVDVRDLTILLLNNDEPGTFSWDQGDFNYDGSVNVRDLTLLLINMGETLS